MHEVFCRREARMVKAVLFDLDMTLVDSLDLAVLRQRRIWSEVAEKMDLIRPFRTTGSIAPHQLPGQLKALGFRIGIVTSSPQPYATAALCQFGIAYDQLLSYADTSGHKPDPEPLLEALRRLGVQPGPDAIHVGDDEVDIEAARRAGLLSVAVRWGCASVPKLSSSAPDIFIAAPGILLQPDRLAGRGYIGEAMIGNCDFHPHWGSVLRCDVSPPVYALGRYFAASDPRHAQSALSSAILALKSDDRPAQRFGEIVGSAISRGDWKPDFVVPVPMKPSQSRNRFAGILKAAVAHMNPDIAVVPEGLSCVRDTEGYKQTGKHNRSEAMKFAFRTKRAWNGAKILVLDDVTTTGATAAECARALLCGGAGEVRIMVLGRTQKACSGRICTACGQPMTIRSNRAGSSRFWGCSAYPVCRHTEQV